MPDEDRDALRSCRVELLDNIGDPISLCDHLYQHRILDADDMENVMSLPTKKERNSHLLRTFRPKEMSLTLSSKLCNPSVKIKGQLPFYRKRDTVELICETSGWLHGSHSLNDNHQISFCHSPMQYGIKLYTWNKGILPFSWKEYNNLKTFKLRVTLKRVILILVSMISMQVG